jgi:hypothetical protein
MKLAAANINLPKHLFWDVDYHSIDTEKHYPYIVERVLSVGSWENFKALIDIYGKQKVGEIAMRLRYLDKKSLAFCSAYFDLKIEQFRCYTYKQSRKVHWNY